jgi:hypothetical protein
MTMVLNIHNQPGPYTAKVVRRDTATGDETDLGTLMQRHPGAY